MLDDSSEDCEAKEIKAVRELLRYMFNACKDGVKSACLHVSLIRYAEGLRVENEAN